MVDVAMVNVAMVDVAVFDEVEARVNVDVTMVDAMVEEPRQPKQCWPKRATPDVAH